ncbi:hypothetical protein AvCA_23270 [Azotobacter vinelandii CA]|uniref:Uncharacterized protein n=2 Tax=Azotobacter vinelandii TaxID=354 RepID=C1DHC0_AZOVD|nr:hypothetical protein Avin_23270 [Azotobacter vinelandii DJ]AGK16703.1 hypothetical protein AvCA_23270 [Azotobacter vinelandii CA]AGK20566.1 hypothetical protein AvCA6_23270 [Azotobacter vinelandii CA6]
MDAELVKGNYVLYQDEFSTRGWEVRGGTFPHDSGLTRENK